MRTRHSVDVGLTETALRNPVLKRIVGAFAAVTVGEWVLGTTVAVHAYTVGGALLVGLVGFRFLPAAVAGLFTAQFAETHRRARVLTATATARTALSGVIVISLALKLPFAVPLILVWLDAVAGSAYRPAQATLLPTLVHSPGEFAAATALTSNAKSSGQMFGALAGGLLVANVPIAAAVSVSTALYAISALATAGIRASAPPLSAQVGLAGRLARMRAGIDAIRRDREALEIVGYACLRSLNRGLWMSLGVVASITLLGLGKAGFGVLMAAAGAGALLAIPLSALLVGRRLLARFLALALVACGLLIAAIGAAAGGAPAVVFMVGWGTAMAISDVAGQAVLFRIVPPVSIARVTGLMESAKLVFEGGASLLAPLAVLLFGIRGALLFAGGIVAVLVAAGTRAFARIDSRALGRVEILQLVAGVELFRHMRVDLLEGVVARLERLVLPEGSDVTRQGRHDDGGWYLVDKGRLAVLIDGFEVNELTHGDSFGELALLRERPRAATVRALTEVELLTLDRDAFLTAVGGGDIELSGALGAGETASDDPVELLARVPLLGGVGRGQIAELARSATLREVATAAPIVSEGERDDSYYVLISGRARVLVAGEARSELLAGDGFGEIAVLHRVPRTATVVASEDCKLLALPGDALRALLATRGGLVAELAAAPAADGTPDVKNKISEPVGRHSVDGSGPLEIEEEGRV
ncbi:MAG TPA: cyclic nucleotide-binding domain-containing protein [Solirubrobacteraceae bacterium]|nr:cyclic nucleotide-binding domain-containing protein [Solirubrobacteraceae bacterium]